MKFIILISFFLFVSGSSLADDKIKNSFEKKLQLEDVNLLDIDRANLCLELVDYYVNSNADSALYFNNEAEKCFDAHNQKQEKLDSLWIRVKANILTNSGLIAFNKGDFVNALAFHNQSTEYWGLLDDKLQLGVSYNNLAVIYKNAKAFDKAFELYTKSLEILKQTKNKSKIAMVHNNIANLYKETKEYKVALIHAKQARDLRLDPFDKTGYASALNNIGNIYYKLGQLDSAKVNLSKAHELVKESGHTLGLAFVEKNLAEVYFALKEVDSAIQMGESSLKLAQKVQNIVCINDAARILAKIYESQQKWDKAFAMEKLYSSSSEEIKLKELNSDLLRGEIEFEYEKQRLLDRKKLDEELLNTQKQKEKQTIGLIAAVAIIILILIFLWASKKRNNLLQEKNAQIEEQNNERKVLLKEVHHRVKNNFQITTSLLRLQSEKINNNEVHEAFQEAINRLQAMAGVHEIIYKNDSFARMEHGKYIERLVNNLQNTFNNRKVEINLVATDRKGSVTLSVPMGIIINELITNSYKHAFSEQQANPKIDIALSFADSSYLLVYKDNGVGIEAEEDKDSFGYELIQTMVSQLSGSIKYEKEKDWNTVIIIQFKE